VRLPPLPPPLLLLVLVFAFCAEVSIAHASPNAAAVVAAVAVAAAILAVIIASERARARATWRLCTGHVRGPLVRTPVCSPRARRRVGHPPARAYHQIRQLRRCRVRRVGEGTEKYS
jgi:hypothetical protein